MILYKASGVIRNELYTPGYDPLSDEFTRKVFYFEAKDFKKAVTKSKKMLHTIHSLAQVNGEIGWDND